MAIGWFTALGNGAGISWLALWLAATIPRIQVEGGPAGSAPTDACIDGQRVEQMLATRLPATDETAPPWRLRQTPRAADDGQAATVIAIALVDPTGAVRVSKELRVAPGECDAATSAVVAMVERFFRDVAWSAHAPLPAPTPPPAPPAPAITHQSSPPAPPAIVTLMAGGASWISGRANLHATVGARLDVPAWRARLDLQALLPAASRTASLSSVATAAEDQWPLRAAFAFAARADRLDWQVGLDSLTTLDRARSQGISAPASKTRLALALGLSAGLGWQLGDRWALGLDAAAYRSIVARPFYIADDPSLGGDILAPARWQGFVGARLGYSLRR